MRALPARFIADESGQGLIEYAMIVALVATALIAIGSAFAHPAGIAAVRTVPFSSARKWSGAEFADGKR